MAESTPEGAPVARRALVGMLGAGAAGLVAAPYVQRGWESVLAKASEHDQDDGHGGEPDRLPQGGIIG